MANGNPNFVSEELPGLERFFASIAPILETFACRFNLRLTKYHNQSPGWGFAFRHPLGGIANIQALKKDREELLLAAHWWLDDYVTFRRSAVTPYHVVIKRDDPALAATLESMLRRLVAMKRDSLRPDGMNYESNWKPERISELKNANLSYPVPRID
jgi:hypothetical protein